MITQRLAWVLSIVTISIEVLGIIITLLARQNASTQKAEYAQITSEKDPAEQFDSLRGDVDSILDGLTPNDRT
jgi:hypothetical protein